MHSTIVHHKKYAVLFNILLIKINSYHSYFSTILNHLYDIVCDVIYLQERTSSASVRGWAKTARTTWLCGTRAPKKEAWNLSTSVGSVSLGHLLWWVRRSLFRHIMFAIFYEFINGDMTGNNEISFGADENVLTISICSRCTTHTVVVRYTSTVMSCFRVPKSTVVTHGVSRACNIVHRRCFGPVINFALM